MAVTFTRLPDRVRRKTRNPNDAAEPTEQGNIDRVSVRAGRASRAVMSIRLAGPVGEHVVIIVFKNQTEVDRIRCNLDGWQTWKGIRIRGAIGSVGLRISDKCDWRWNTWIKGVDLL